MKIALYQSKYSLSAHEASNWIEESKDYVRTSEVLDIDFPLLPIEDVTAARVESIDSEITEVCATLKRRIDELTNEKRRLLAITHNPTGSN
jgi:hypothetical protein